MFTVQQCMEYAEKVRQETALKACLRCYHQHGQDIADDLAKYMGIPSSEWENAMDNWLYQQDRILAEEAEREYHESMIREEAA